VESRARSPRSPDQTSTRAAHTACRPAIRRTAAGPGDLVDDARAASAHTADAIGSRPERSRNDGHYVTGLPGVGKTHLAISLAIAAAQSGRRVYYGTLADLITSLEEAQAAGRLHARLKVLTHPALLVVDEIGYLPITRTGAMLFFQLMTRRYEHASTVLTSNKGFEDWGDIFGDDVMAAALIDRLVHHCHLVTIRGNSYRMRQHTELWQTLHGHQDAEPAAPRRRRTRQEGSTN
jgi:DNA replication protein DnaC